MCWLGLGITIVLGPYIVTVLPEMMEPTRFKGDYYLITACFGPLILLHRFFPLPLSLTNSPAFLIEWALLFPVYGFLASIFRLKIVLAFVLVVLLHGLAFYILTEWYPV